MQRKNFLAAAAAIALSLAASGAAAQISDRTLRLSTGDPEAAPGPTANKRFAELIEKASGGKIKVRTYHSGMLGNDVQAQGMLQGGTVDFALVGAPTLVGLVKEFGVLDFPYMFRNTAEVDAMLDGPAGQGLLKKLEAKGIVGLRFWEIGFRQVTNSRRAITKWEDLSGIKIRTVQSPVFREFFNDLGANATPMAVTEVYTALETRAIDGQENPPTIISALKLPEVQKYLSLTGHIYTSYALIASQKTWEKLSPEERNIVMKAAAEAGTYERQLARAKNAELLEELKKQMTVNEISPAELARFAEKAKPVRAKFTETMGAEFVRDWFAALDKVRAETR